MSLPSELPDIGSTAQCLRQNPRFDPVQAGIGPEEYFVWTRFDGATSLKDLVLMTGLPQPRALDVVRKLRAVGAILLPGEKPEAVAARVPAPPAAAPAGKGRARPDSDSAPTIERGPAPIHDTIRMPPLADDERPTTRLGTADLRGEVQLSAEETAALTEEGDLGPDDRARILAMHRRVQSGDPRAILGLAPTADKRAAKRAYFALSKEFHPDRYYGKKTGSFGPRLTAIFEALSRAYETLSEDRPRRASGAAAPAPAQTQTPADHAAEIFDRACQAEVSGDRASALTLFAAVLRVDPQARYLRRAARCAMQAGEHRTALEYAKKAANLEPNDPSTARLLAQAFRAAGKLADAEETLVLALMIKSENDQLTTELQSDLAEVRRLASR